MNITNDQGSEPLGDPSDPNLVAVVGMMFPKRLEPELRSVLAVLEPGPRNDHYESPPFLVEGERLQLLARFYLPEPTAQVVAHLTPRQRLLLACLYSRHHEGRVRESHLRGLKGDEAWLPVFVLRLVSEYVIEIGQLALDNLDAVPRPRYEAFAAENPAFMATTRSRIVSYHNEYYRQSFELAAYPAYRFLDSLGLWPNRVK